VAAFVKKYIEGNDLKPDKLLLRVLSIIKTILEIDYWVSIEVDLIPIAKDVVKICNMQFE